MKVQSDCLFAGLEPPGAAEQLTPLLQGNAFRCERIVSRGHATPPGQWYDQSEDEWVILLTGSARLLIEGESEPRDLRPGDWVSLPAHVRHRVESTDDAKPTVWLAIHYEPTAGA